MIYESAEETINAGVGNGGALYLAIDAGDWQILLIEQRLRHAAIATALERQQQAIQIDAVG